MSRAVYEAGKVILAEKNSTVDISTLYTIANDAAFPTKWTGTTANGAVAAGTPVLHMFFEWDGTDGAMYTLDGTTPDNTTGMMVMAGTMGVSVGAAGTSNELVIRGQTPITNLLVIAMAGASILVTWYIEIDDNR